MNPADHNEPWFLHCEDCCGCKAVAVVAAALVMIFGLGWLLRWLGA